MNCGCKGIRFCAACKNSERVQGLQHSPESYSDKFLHYKCYMFVNGTALETPTLRFDSTVEEIYSTYDNLLKNDNDENRGHNSFTLSGITLIENFLSEAEEEELTCRIDNTEWLLSQSGRRKQDYGPRVNFKEKKVKCERFVGVPDYADLILQRLEAYDVQRFGSYRPFELCNLEYNANRQSAIELHRDDTWIWGERLISLNLLESSVMTFEDQNAKVLVFVLMPRRSILCFCDEARYKWMHGIFSWHIRNRRIALTMREPANDFKEGGCLFEKYGKELIERGCRRIKTSVNEVS